MSLRKSGIWILHAERHPWAEAAESAVPALSPCGWFPGPTSAGVGGWSSRIAWQAVREWTPLSWRESQSSVRPGLGSGTFRSQRVSGRISASNIWWFQQGNTSTSSFVLDCSLWRRHPEAARRLWRNGRPPLGLMQWRRSGGGRQHQRLRPVESARFPVAPRCSCIGSAHAQTASRPCSRIRLGNPRTRASQTPGGFRALRASPTWPLPTASGWRRHCPCCSGSAWWNRSAW